MADGCRSIFHRLNCITAPKIISAAYGEAVPVPIATLCACALQTKPSPKPSLGAARAGPEPKQSIRGSAWGALGFEDGGVKYEPGVFLERGFMRSCCGLCLWDLSLCLQSSRVHCEESGKQQLHLWSLPGARGGRRRKRRRRWVLCGLLQCLGPALLCHTCVVAQGEG